MQKCFHFCIFDLMKDYKINDTVILKKKHPCGSDSFKIIYCASDVKLICTKCSRMVMIERVKLDKAIKGIIPNV